MERVQHSGFIPGKEQSLGSVNSSVHGQTASKVRGEWVQWVPVSQSLADAAEELTFMFSERVGKSLAKRKIDDGNACRQARQLEELAQQYLRKVPDLESGQKLQDLLARLSQDHPGTVAQLQKHLDGFSREISHQFMALCWIKNQLAEKTPLLTLVDQTITAMALDQGMSIELGIIVSPLVAEAASHPDDMQPLRETCRDAVRDCSGLTQAMKEVQAHFSPVSVALEKAIDVLMKMLAADYLNIYLDQVKRGLIVRYMRYLQILKKLREDIEVIWGTLITQDRSYGIRSF